MDESSFLDDPELLSELAELGTFDDEPNKMPLNSPIKQAAAALAGDTSANQNDGTLELVPDVGSDDEDDDPSLRADLAALMVGSGKSEAAGAPHSVASAAEPSSSSSVAKTAAAHKAAAARKEAAAARATALGITQEAATALKLESFALNKAGDKAGAAAKFRAFKAMEKELAAAASASGGASSAPSGSASTSNDIPRMAPVAAASTPDHALQAPVPPLGGPQDAVQTATESAMAAVTAAQSLLVDCEPADGDGDDPELLGELSALHAQPASSQVPAASTTVVVQDTPSAAVAAKAGGAAPSVVTAEALAELQQKMFALNAAGNVREAGAVRKEFKKLEAQFKAQPPPPPPPPQAAPSDAATPKPTAAAPVNSEAPAAFAAPAVTTAPPAPSTSLPAPPADEMYVAPPAAAVLASVIATTATTPTTTVNSLRGEATENTQGSPGAAVTLSPEVAQEVAQLKLMAQAQWRAGDKEAGRALLRQAKALETNSAATPPPSSSSLAIADAPPPAPQPPQPPQPPQSPAAVVEAQGLRAQAVAAKEEAVAFHKAGKKEEARAALLRAKKLEASAIAAAAATTAGATTGAGARSSRLTAPSPSPSPSSQPSTVAAGAANAGQTEAHAAGWDALEAALSNLIAERSSRYADSSNNSNNTVGAAAGGGGDSGSGNDSKGGGGRSGEEWASASEECVALEALQTEVRARRRSNASGGEPAPQFTLGRGVVGAPRAVVVPCLKSDELQVTVFGLEDMIDYAGARLVVEVKMDSSLLLYEDEGSSTFRAPNSEVVSSDGICQFQSTTATASSKDNKHSSSGWCSSFTIKRSPRHARKYEKRACVEVAIMRETKSGWGPFSKTAYEPVAEAKCSLSGLLEKCSVNQLMPLHAVGHPRKAVRGRLSCLARVHHPLGTTGNGAELRSCVGTTITLGPWGGGGIGTGPPAQALTGASAGAAASSSGGGAVAQRASGVKTPAVGLASAGKGGKGRATAAGAAAPGGRGGKGGGANKSASTLSPEQTAQFAQLTTNEKRDPLSATLLVSEAVLEAELAKPNLEEMRRMTLNTQMYTLKVAIDAGQLSPDGYLANLANRISRDTVLAKFLVFQQRRPEAANVLARVKVMKKEIEDVKAMLANQPPE